VIARHRLNARRSLGQHFLLDANLTARIARAAGALEGRHVVEVGPGPGGLTRALLATGAADVTVVEIDERAVAAMQELRVRAGTRLHVVAGDAMARVVSVDVGMVNDECGAICECESARTIGNSSVTGSTEVCISFCRIVATLEFTCAYFLQLKQATI